jgi:hypothetical protein
MAISATVVADRFSDQLWGTGALELATVEPTDSCGVFAMMMD